MVLSSALPLIASVKELADILPCLENDLDLTFGVPDEAKVVTIATLWKYSKSPVVIIVSRENDAHNYLAQLKVWTDTEVIHYPSHGILPYERKDIDPSILQQRLTTISKLNQHKNQDPPLIITSIQSLGSHTSPQKDFKKALTTISLNQEVNLDLFIKKIISIGYKQELVVTNSGEFAHRGGIVDLFSPLAIHPVRIEFFGNVIDSIRTFNPVDQRTVQHQTKITFGPASEWIPTSSEIANFAYNNSNVSTEKSLNELADLKNGYLTTPSFYGPLLSKKTLLDYIPSNSLIIFDEMNEIDLIASEQDELSSERKILLIKNGDLDPKTPESHMNKKKLFKELKKYSKTIELNRWSSKLDKKHIRLPFSQSKSFSGKLNLAAQDFSKRKNKNHHSLVITEQAQRYSEILTEHGVINYLSEHLNLSNLFKHPTIIQNSLPSGWVLTLPSSKLELISDRELFGFTKIRRNLRKKSIPKSRFLSDIKPGDYIVHVDHGIAQFSGIVRRPLEDRERDYIQLSYASDDKLYVPIEQIDRISKYVGPSGQNPRLTRLGTSEWNRARSKVRDAVSTVAADLVRLYAARQMLQGHAFSEDTPWQDELEKSFPYEETHDQLEAILAVKKDMESLSPMDRLICGDVGFGKTEIAIRAAFKAVQDNLQVAVLVPTTVLAQQHLQTFQERMSGFPININAISRFNSVKEAQIIINQANTGEIDILIGTHRLLDPNIQFNNLGLVIIDEEQRFGVSHKERLKRLRLEVDVLTLSATPIPRTMHMALSGIRDTSIIQTAPENRQAIKTHVSEWNPNVIREAILHEIERGGQVYLIHNRVQTIDQFSQKIKKLVPESKIAIAHGQMPQSVLQSVMKNFSTGHFDVLICTTIIESGIDIPNANTLIVERADQLGLAQMYQLRGRVGRSINQAYAYLMYPTDKVLTGTARERLSSIFEASELGSGFQIALRDLEIRGAGNLLGAEQSGSIASVGFDLYTQMLAEEVEILKSKQEHRKPLPLPHEQYNKMRSIMIDIPLGAFIPETYMPKIDERLALYQRIAILTTREETITLENEILDRYGNIPEALTQLFQFVRIRIAAFHGKIKQVSYVNNKILLVSEEVPFTQRKLPKVNLPIKVGNMQLHIDPTSSDKKWLEIIEWYLEKIQL
tara:strand:+ start:17501 stop:20944 length:3444 start_codon:yes stop_codon:yes gene_type:complete